jgi:predicted nucleotidyltransferase
MKFFRIEKTLLVENQQVTHPIQQLDEIDALASTIDDNISKEVNIPKDVLNSFKIKDSLNKDIWPEGNLNLKVKTKLIDIAKDFMRDIELPKGIKIKDIIFTGSLAGYNWSKFSDIDLHIVLDFKQFDADEKLIDDLFYAQKSIWNQEHDITVFDYPVELYVQNVNHELVANAVYSVLRDKWIKKPKREEFDVDKKAIKDGAEKYINYLKDIRQDYQDKQYKTVIDKVTKLKNKIKNMRKAGLESGGEYSYENLVFKVLRRTPFMDILDSYKAKSYDNLMSVAENLTENLLSPEEKIIAKYRIGKDSRVQFKNDPRTYYVKNVSADRKNLFVTLNMLQTYSKKISNLVKVDNKDVVL